MTDAIDVTSTLAELERKLHELERELTSIGRRRVEPDPSPVSTSAETAAADAGESLATPSPNASDPTSPPATHDTLSASENPSTSDVPPAQDTPQNPYVADPLDSPPAPYTDTAFAAPDPPPIAMSDELLVDEVTDLGRPLGPVEPAAPANAPGTAHAPRQEQTAGPSEAQLASLAELRRFRDRLERFSRELASEYDVLLGRVMAGFSSAAQSRAYAPSATIPSPAPTAVSSAQPSTTSASTPDVASAASPTAPSMPPAIPATPAISPASATPATAYSTPPAAPADSQQEALFEGHVELGVGPFYDIDTLSAFERRLAALPNVTDASVRRFEASHAVVDLHLATPMALVRELRHGLNTDFSVRQVADGRILLTFDEA
jgi:hypothetical protein